MFVGEREIENGGGVAERIECSTFTYFHVISHAITLNACKMGTLVSHVIELMLDSVRMCCKY